LRKLAKNREELSRKSKTRRAAPKACHNESIKAHLRDMGKPPVLDREEKIRLIKQIEEGRRRMERAVFICPISCRDLRALGKRLEKDKMRIIDAVRVNVWIWTPASAGRLERRQAHQSIKRVLRLSEDIERVGGRRSTGVSAKGEKHCRAQRKRLLTRRLKEGANLRLHYRELENLAKRPKDLAARLSRCDGEIQSVEKEAGCAAAKILILARLARRGSVKSAEALRAAGMRSKECVIFEKRIRDARRKARMVELTAQMPAHQLVHLVREIAEGERMVKDGRSELVGGNTRLVISIAKRHLNRGVEFLDLLQEGTIGLGWAIEKFDWREGYRFSPYATWWIRQAIIWAIRDQTSVTVRPSHITEATHRVLRASRKLIQQYGHEPTPGEIAKTLNLPSATVKSVLKADERPTSLGGPSGGGEGGKIEGSEAFAMLQEAISKVLLRLMPDEPKVIRVRFGLRNCTVGSSRRSGG
jgi:RNA polymerase primary sigma factor